MITKDINSFKITTTKQAITSFAGLPLLMGMARNIGLEEQLNKLPLKERSRGYKPAESVFALMGLIQSGGEALSDISLLNRGIYLTPPPVGAFSEVLVEAVA